MNNKEIDELVDYLCPKGPRPFGNFEWVVHKFNGDYWIVDREATKKYLADKIRNFYSNSNI